MYCHGIEFDSLKYPPDSEYMGCSHWFIKFMVLRVFNLAKVQIMDGEDTNIWNFNLNTRRINNIILSPNPFRDVLNNSFNQKEKSPVQFFFYNSTGQLVYQQTITEASGIISLPNLSSGLFYYLLRYNEGGTIGGKCLHQ